MSFSTLVLLLLLPLLLLATTTTIAVVRADDDEAAATTSSFTMLRPTTDDEAKAHAVLHWIVSQGGYVSPKLEVRRADAKSQTFAADATAEEDMNVDSHLGAFAKSDIETDEVLFEIPQSCFIHLPEEEIVRPTKEEEEREDALPPHEYHNANLHRYHANLCTLSRKLVNEWKLGPEHSHYGPYIEYLQGIPRGQIPASWSSAGKQVLRTVLGKPQSHNPHHFQGSPHYGLHQLLPPADMVDWIERWHKDVHRCAGKDPEDPHHLLENHALTLVVQRGYDTALIPLWDMINHHNGKVNAVTDTLSEVDETGKMIVRASQPIKEGEELYASYNMCQGCGDQSEYWGTPEILRDFGFVEPYPQLWVFLDHDVWFELDEYEYVDEDTNATVKDVWAYFWKKGGGRPDQSAIRFFENQLRRLIMVGEDVLHHRNRYSMPDHEWNTIVQFHEAMVDAITALLEAVEYERVHGKQMKEEMEGGGEEARDEL